MAAKTSKQAAAGSATKLALLPVMRCDNPGLLSVPNHLYLGNDGRLYLTRSIVGKVRNSYRSPSA